MAQMKLSEQQKALEASFAENGFPVVVEASDGAFVLTGRLASERECEAVLGLARGIAPDARFESNLEVVETRPENIARVERGDARAPELAADEQERADAVAPIEPDFTDQPLEVDNRHVVEDAEEAYFPPTDPVSTTGTQGDAEFLGGFGPTSTDSVEVDRSALDNRIGDEAIIDAVKRELAEDALTTDLDVHVFARNGVVRLHGIVSDVEDAENAEAVAARVPGVREVIEELEVANG